MSPRLSVWAENLFAGDVWHRDFIHGGGDWRILADPEPYLDEDGGPSGVLMFPARDTATGEQFTFFALTRDDLQITPAYAAG